MNKIRLFFLQLYYNWLQYKLRIRNVPLEHGTKVVILPKNKQENSNYSLRKLGGRIYHRGKVVGFERGKIDVEWTHLTVASGHPHKLFALNRLLRVDVLPISIEIREISLQIRKYKRKVLIKKFKNESNTKR